MKSRNIDKLHAQIATSVKQRIRILRENNNYSQREIAEYLGIDRSTYACYELGKTSPSVEVLVALSELYLVSCEFLLGDIVNIGLHFFLKDVRPMLPPVMNHSIAVA